MTVHLLRVNEYGIAKWWLCSATDLIRGKSDWSKTKMLQLWQGSYGKITKLVSYEGKFSPATAAMTVSGIQHPTTEAQ